MPEIQPRAPYIQGIHSIRITSIALVLIINNRPLKCGKGNGENWTRKNRKHLCKRGHNRTSEKVAVAQITERREIEERGHTGARALCAEERASPRV